jgi:hypothetical protein
MPRPRLTDIVALELPLTPWEKGEIARRAERVHQSSTGWIASAIERFLDHQPGYDDPPAKPDGATKIYVELPAGSYSRIAGHFACERRSEVLARVRQAIVWCLTH